VRRALRARGFGHAQAGDGMSAGPPPPWNVLFLCTHNSGRSILAEAIANHVGAGWLRGYSAGSHPAAAPNPMALETLGALGVATEGLSSKAWDAFAPPDAPRLDMVITVCDDAAGEACPVWPGTPVTAHWGMPDPARTPGTDDDRRRAFLHAAATLRDRIERLVAATRGASDRASLERAARRLGDAA
jgi:protein-tyrosine-phosphatase